MFPGIFLYRFSKRNLDAWASEAKCSYRRYYEKNFPQQFVQELRIDFWGFSGKELSTEVCSTISNRFLVFLSGASGAIFLISAALETGLKIMHFQGRAESKIRQVAG